MDFLPILLCFISLFVISECANPDYHYLYDELFDNLHYYGPTRNDGQWKARPLNLTADYTYSIQLRLDVNQQFLLVNIQSNGLPNWKQTKLGRGISEGSLEFGGGNIWVNSRGYYLITIVAQLTPVYSLQYTLQPINDEVYPSIILYSNTFVTNNTRNTITGLFSEPVVTDNFNKDLIGVYGGNMVVNSFTIVSPTVFTFDVDTATNSEYIYINIPERIVNATKDSIYHSTSASYSYIYVPPSKWVTASFEKATILRHYYNNSNLWVTAIHANFIPNTGEMLITGWSRGGEFGCNGDQLRRNGVTFKVNPADLIGSSVPTELYINSNMVNEDAESPTDVLYCSGHTTLRGGLKLFTGGARYNYLDTGVEEEYGLSYARLYNPYTNTMTRINQTNPIGSSWYPTNLLLPDGRKKTSIFFFS